VEAHIFSLDEPGGLPQGLIGLYERWFRRQFPDRARYAEFIPLLEVLVAPRRPVPEALLVAMFHWTEPQRTRLLHGLGSLFEKYDDGWAPFHPSLRDWLTHGDHAGADFVVDVAAGNRRLANALWGHLLALLDAPVGTLPDDFTLAELPAQLASQDAAMLRSCLVAAGAWPRLRDRLGDIISISKHNVRWRYALDWLRLYDELADLSGDAARHDRPWGLVETGDILTTIGETGPALEAYQSSKLVAERLVALAPENVDWQRDLSISLDRIGEVLVAQGELPHAEQAFRSGMDIRKRLAEQDPGNAHWQRDLSVSLDRIGDVLVAQGELPQAEQAFRACMAIARRLVEQDPGNAQWQRDLSISHNKIGNVLVAQGELPQAEQAFRAGMDIRKRLAEQDPGNAQWQRDLSVSLDRIGDVLVAQGELPQAEQAFRACMAIARRLVEQDPGNARWQRDVLVSLFKLADAATTAGACQAARRYGQEAVLCGRALVAHFPRHPGFPGDLAAVDVLWRRIEAACP
jgi:tetratricopeptide (TPR) repeat protein